MHRDLSDEYRAGIDAAVRHIVGRLSGAGQSLGISREAMIDAFDKAAAELDQRAAMDTLLKIDGELYDGGDDGTA